MGLNGYYTPWRAGQDAVAIRGRVLTVDAEGACGLGDGIAALGDELDRLGRKLGGVSTPLAGPDGPPRVMIHR